MKSNLQQVAEELNLDCRPYSGRGMMGRYCLGIQVGDLLEDIAFLFWEMGKEQYIIPEQIKWDDMGPHGYIIYFPKIEFFEEEEEIEE